MTWLILCGCVKHHIFVATKRQFLFKNWSENGYVTFLSRSRSRLFVLNFFLLFCLLFNSTHRVQIQFPISVPIISCHHTIVHKIITVNSIYIIQQAHTHTHTQEDREMKIHQRFRLTQALWIHSFSF